eukprot:15446415-Alexandrium_andersonii.AAC.1
MMWHYPESMSDQESPERTPHPESKSDQESPEMAMREDMTKMTQRVRATKGILRGKWASVEGTRGGNGHVWAFARAYFVWRSGSTQEMMDILGDMALRPDMAKRIQR